MFQKKPSAESVQNIRLKNYIYVILLIIVLISYAARQYDRKKLRGIIYFKYVIINQ